MNRREIINAEIGARLKEARLAANLTLKEAGDLIGISGSVVRRYEIGTIKSIGIDVLRKFADIYETPAYALLGWEIPDTFPCSKDEQDLIVKYRTLSPEEQETINDIIDIRYQKRLKETKVKIDKAT